MKQLQGFILFIILSSFFSIAHAELNWDKMLVGTFESLGSDVEKIQHKTKRYSANSWYRASVFDVAMIGGGACAVPLSGAVALPAEFAYLIREIYNSSMGLGFLINGTAHKDDFAIILGLWTEEVTLEDKTLHHLLDAVEATGMPEKVVTSLASGGVVSQLLAKKTGAKVAGQLAAKVAAKVGVKISSKYAAKMATVWIPGVSALVCGSLNAWIMNGVLSSAESYYQQRARVRKART